MHAVPTTAVHPNAAAHGSDRRWLASNHEPTIGCANANCKRSPFRDGPRDT